MFPSGTNLFGSPAATTPATGSTATTTQSGFPFGSGFQAGTKASTFTFNTPTTSTAVQGGAVPSGVSFGATTSAQPSFSFSGSTATSAAASTAAATTTSTFPVGTSSTVFSQLPTSTTPSFNFNPTGATTTASGATTTSITLASTSGTLGLASKPATTTTSGVATKPSFSFPTTTLGATSTATPATTGLSLATSTAPASTTGTTGMFSLGTSSAATTTAATTSLLGGTTTPAAETQINFRQLEEQINKWMLELEEQEKAFLHQATQVNAWDRLLLDNGEKIHLLNHDVDRVKIHQQRLDNELDFIRSQQKELEDLLMPLESAMEQLPPLNYQHHADLEREYTYQLAENIDGQLKRMVLDLKEMIDHLNTTNSTEENTDPIHQITKILNAHMDSLRWIDQNAGKVLNPLLPMHLLPIVAIF